MASRQEIKSWLECGKKQGATHMIVVCDTYDWDDYPAYVMPGEDVKLEASKYSGKNMQKVMEVYSYNHDLNAQMNERRAFHYD
jgi:hypothetical protein